MNFYDRKQEIAQLLEIEKLSHEVSQFTVVSGRRRIGKTELVRKAYEDKKMLYFFVARKAEADLCDTFMSEISEKLAVPIPKGAVRNFSNVFQFVMELAEKQHIILFIDEFQEFAKVNSSIFSEMQNVWDSYKNTARINLVVGGSVKSMLTKIFEQHDEPLFGRQTNKMHIKPFPPSVLKDILHDYAPNYKAEDLLALYTLTGGVAKYVELFIDKKRFTLSKMLKAVFCEDSYFLTEGKDMLVEEFGKDYGMYFSILTLISEGHNTRADLQDMLGNIELAGYLKNLIEHYELISKHQPLYEKSTNRSVHYVVNDLFLRFWFRFVYKYQHVIEAGGFTRLLQLVERDYHTFSGKALESYFRESLKETGLYTRLGYWHDRKGENEIDIVAEDELEKHVTIYEVKRQAKKLNLGVLQERADVYVKSVGVYKDYSVEIKGVSMDDM